MVRNVNQDSLKSYISKMVSFGTRNTLSDIKSKTKGIGAARNWVVKKFNQFAKQSDGRLTAYLDTITFKPDGKRVDQPTLLGNAVAILKGTDANDKRVYMVSGHLDSRVTDVMNRTSDAPGANDDGSGVAGVIEAARIMSQYKFPATIIFVAVSGEEQSLLGSGFMAAKAKKKTGM
ncbi:M20/M25/M40 family metallo-hydrolase [Pedobacter sp. P26]|uniref:M20/M25/M40 family metallo-hydrolase n=1 Tax=Pedobacter sp. P26 TaxID=3423956 RepID=UPI003D67101B